MRSKRKMANAVLTAILAGILCPFLVGCTAHNNRGQITQEAHAMLEVQETTDDLYEVHFGYQKELGNWLTPEEEYLYDPEGDSSVGIVDYKSHEYIPANERFFFMISKQTTYKTGDNFYAYVSTKTGEKHYICPDPLCEHDRDSDCPYIELSQLKPSQVSETLLYAVRKNNVSNTAILQDTIYEIDTAANTIRPIYTASAICDTANVDYITLQYIVENTLYFTDRFLFYEIVDGEKIITEQTWFLSLDLKTKDLSILNDHFDENIDTFYLANDRLFYANTGECTLYCTDYTLSENIPLLQYPTGYQVNINEYDSNTKELYVLVTNSALRQAAHYPENPEEIVCTLYCIDADLHCTEVPMPSSQITDFQLTNEYIYYRIYDPINYKEPQYDRNVIECYGNKLYRVKRSDTLTPEIAFDGHEELFFMDYYVSGDYLYFDYYAIVIRAEGQVFRRMGATARVNMKENTIKWLNLD